MHHTIHSSIRNGLALLLVLSCLADRSMAQNCAVQACSPLVGGSFDQVTPGGGNDPFSGGNVACWTSAFGSPQAAPDANSPSLHALMWSNGQGFNPAVVGEGVATRVALQQDQPYNLFYELQFAPGPSQAASVNNVFVVLSNTGPANVVNGQALLAAAGSQVIDRVTNVRTTSWARRSPCFTPSATYNWLYIFPQQNVGSGTGWIRIDDVAINDSPISPAFALPDNLCAGEKLTFKDLNGCEGTGSQWDIFAGSCCGDSLKTCWGSECKFTASQPGTYEIRHGEWTSCQSWQEERQVFQVQPVPDAGAGSDRRICTGESTTLGVHCRFLPPFGELCTHQPVQPGVSYQWTPSTGVDHPTSLETSANPTQSTTYKLIATNKSGCSTTDTITVTVDPQPEVSVSIQGDCCSQKAVAQAIAEDTLTWSDGTNGPVLEPTQGGEFVVTASNRCGEARAAVEIPKSLEGSFSPIIYGSGFQPPAIWTIEDYHLATGEQPAYNATAFRLYVFDRWGTQHLVDEGISCSGLTNGEIAWDGTLNGSLVPQGVYTWILELDNCSQKKQRRLEHRKARRICKKKKWDWSCFCRRCVEWETEEYSVMASTGSVTVVR